MLTPAFYGSMPEKVLLPTLFLVNSHHFKTAAAGFRTEWSGTPSSQKPAAPQTPKIQYTWYLIWT